MEAATVSHSASAAETSERLPACSAPMVGTRPRECLPGAALRRLAHAACISARVLQTSIRSGFARARLGRCEGRMNLAGKVVALGVVGKSVGRYIVAVVFEGGGEEGSAVGILAREFCLWREGEVEEIVEDQDLAVAIRARAYANRGYATLGSDAGGQFPRDSLEHDGDGTRIFESERIGCKTIHRGEGLALNAISSHAVDGLRREAYVGNHGNLRFRQALDQFGARAATLDLDCLSARVFHKANGVVRERK